MFLFLLLTCTLLPRTDASLHTSSDLSWLLGDLDQTPVGSYKQAPEPQLESLQEAQPAQAPVQDLQALLTECTHCNGTGTRRTGRASGRAYSQRGWVRFIPGATSVTSCQECSGTGFCSGQRVSTVHQADLTTRQPTTQADEPVASTTPTSGSEGVQNMDRRVPFFEYSNNHSWFQQTFGYAEKGSPVANQEMMRIQRAQVRPFGTERHSLEYIVLENDARTIACGAFKEYTAQELTSLIHSQNDPEGDVTRPSTAIDGEIRVTEQKVEDAYKLNGAVAQSEQNEPGALVQAASQFNYLEMIYAWVPPSAGFTEYPSDKTQGPRCAVATPGATWVRNHLLTTGDDEAEQMNGMRSVMKSLGDGVLRFSNGYIFPGDNFQGSLAQRAGEDDEARKQLEKLLLEQMNVGFSFDAETISRTRDGQRGYVSSAWCSAVPLGYMSPQEARDMTPLAKAVLKASYKATILAAIAHGKKTVYLTEVGGGVFANTQESITDAMLEAVDYAKEQNFGRALEVKVVSWIGDIQDWSRKYGSNGRLYPYRYGYDGIVREPRARALGAQRLEGFADDIRVPVWEVDCSDWNGLDDWKPISANLESLSQIPAAERPAFVTPFGTYYLREGGFAKDMSLSHVRSPEDAPLKYAKAQWHQISKEDADNGISCNGGARMRQIRRRLIEQ